MLSNSCGNQKGKPLSFFKELKQRNVFKVAITYLVITWFVMQVVDVVLNNIVAPGWIFHVLMLFLAVGFPFAIFLAWAFELTADGIKREHEVDRSQSTTHQTGRKLNLVIIGLMAIALVYFAYDKLIFSTERDNALIETASQAVTEKLAAEVKSQEGADKSIAVLPFVNMSDDASNEFFSEGISEELLNLLAKIPDLHVAARTSSFSLKGKDLQISEVGEILKVAHVLEGSVRKAGNQVRITAQLIKADDGYELWAETYDRSLDNIFVLQDEIAASVVKQLKVVLLGDAPTVRETDPEAYSLYLQGRHLSRQKSVETIEQAQALLQQALDIDPNIAAVWVELGQVYLDQANQGLIPIDEGYTLARQMTEKALEIDPEYAPAHAGLGYISMAHNNNLVAAAQHLDLALKLDPANIEIIRKAAILTSSLGRIDEAIALLKFVVARDPVSPESHSNLGFYYLYAGRLDEALASFSTTLALGPGRSQTHYEIGVILLLKNQPQAAHESMQAENSPWRIIGLPMTYHAMGQPEKSDAAFTTLVEQLKDVAAYNIAYVLAYRGETDRAFEWLDKAVQNKDGGLMQIRGEQLFSNIHDDPRWMPFLKSIGRSPEQLVDIKFEVILPD
jgi:TolB-like protein/Flp pilus assembly protein TadD